MRGSPVNHLQNKQLQKPKGKPINRNAVRSLQQSRPRDSRAPCSRTTNSSTTESLTMGGVSSKEDPQLEPSTSQSACPVPAEYRNPAIYNVYGQQINGEQNCPSAAAANPLAKLQGSDLLDPKNNMPLEPNQQPCPGQRVPLSTERLQSNIPKGGTDTTWLYPSPQMFFNGARGSSSIHSHVAVVAYGDAPGSPGRLQRVKSSGVGSAVAANQSRRSC